MRHRPKPGMERTTGRIACHVVSFEKSVRTNGGVSEVGMVIVLSWRQVIGAVFGKRR